MTPPGGPPPSAGQDRSLRPLAPWLAELTGRAATLAERLSSARLPPACASAPEANIAPRWERWRQLVAGHDAAEDLLPQRLAWLGLDETAARAGVASVPAAARPLPEWARLLALISEDGSTYRPFETASAGSVSDPPHHPALHAPCAAAPPLPFVEFFTPLLRVARRELSAQLARDPDWNAWATEHIAASAWAAMERTLLEELVDLSWRVLLAGFDAARPLGETLFRALGPPSAEAASDARYQAFIRALWRDGGVAWFLEYPALARLLAVRTGFWIESHAELLRRLRRDWPALLAAWAPASATAPQLVSLTEGISDPHHHGRSVALLHFSSAFTCVYKPKPIRLAQRFNALLAWCAAPPSDSPRVLPVRALAILDRGDYGWCEFVAPAPCADPAALGRFYQRAGQLLCLAHVLCGVDFHFDNVIAAGEHPVLIDVESLLHPLFSAETRNAPSSVHAIEDRFAVSVMHASLLPRWRFDPEGQVPFDSSGLASAGHSQFRSHAPRWLDLNTDAMRLEYAPAPEPPRRNLPRLGDVPAHVGEWPEACLAGYRAMHALIAAHAPTLAASDVWRAFRDLPVRFLFRHTLVYGALLRKTIEPHCLRSGLDRSLEFEALARGLFTLRDGDRFRPLLAAEIASLERGDIPLFQTTSTSSSLASDGLMLLESTGRPPPFDVATQRLLDLRPAELAWNCAIIRGTAQARLIGQPSAAARYPKSSALWPASGEAGGPEVDSPPASPLLDPRAAFSASDALAEATRIGDELLAQSWTTDGSTPTWLGFTLFASSRRQFGPVGVDLYEGASGIALFLASLGHVTGRAAYRDTAMRALRPVRDWLDLPTTPRRRWASELGLGGLQGLGSLVYTLTHIARLSDAPDFLATAHQAATLLADQIVTVKPPLEVMRGSAGALLGLLSLHAVSPVPALLAAIESLAAPVHLGLATALELSPPPSHLTPLGFAHGAAGLSHALVRGGRVTGNSPWLEAGLSGLRQLSNLTHHDRPPAAASVPFSRESRALAARMNWCQGIGGIALSFCSALAAHPDTLDAPSVKHALTAAGRAGLQPLDHACCGNAGLIELFATAGHVLREPDYLRRAGALARAVVERRNNRESFSLFTEISTPVFHPGFFQGLSGIGHTLLRLSHRTLPSPLLLE